MEQEEHRLKKAAEEKEALIARLGSINAELRKVIYVVSNDLRAPLRGIIGMTKLLETDIANKLEGEPKENFELLVSNANRMKVLFDGILQYSRILRLSEKRVLIDLNALLPQIIDILFVPEHIKITVQSDLPKVKFEPTGIEQIFQNLLDNSIEDMDKEEGIIRIACGDDGDFWRFSVSDNRPGIDRKHFEKVFGIFQTLQIKGEQENTGAGLALVKKIVELYGGKIWLESEVGKGTTFFFTLPKQSIETEAAEAAVATKGK